MPSFVPTTKGRAIRRIREEQEINRKKPPSDVGCTDEACRMLLEAAKARQSKAWYRRPDDQRAEDKLAMVIRLGPIVRSAAVTAPTTESLEKCAPVMVDLDPTSLKETTQAIRRRVSEHFYLREMRDPELTVRTNRRAHVLPRQLAMYVAKQLTGASLEEIGREFGGRHHTTVLHSINKIEAMRRTDEALNRTIMGLVEAVVAKT